MALLFSIFSDYLNRMTDTSKRLELKQILSSLFIESGADLKKVIYLIQGKIAPDYEGKETGIAEKTVIEILSDISGNDPEIILRKLGKIGDIGSLTQELMNSNKQELLFKDVMTVDKVFNTLKLISEKSGPDSTKIKKDLMKNLLLSGSADEAKYIVRIALGKLRLGVADSTILMGLVDAFHFEDISQDVESYYNFNPDLTDPFHLGIQYQKETE